MRRLVTLVAVAVLVSTAGCAGFLSSESTEQASPVPSPTETPTTAAPPTATPMPTATASPTADATPTATASPTAAATPFPTAKATPRPTATVTETSEPTPTATPVPDNPWDARTLSVTFNDQAESERDYGPVVRRALEYWNGRTAAFSPYDVTFRYAPELSASEADLLVVASEPIEFCGGPVEENTTTSGCYRNPHRIDVYDNQTNLQFRNTLIHELGHALSLRHGDEPKWAMSTAAYEYPGSVPDATERENPWNVTGTLNVTVGREIDDRERYLNELEDVAAFYNANDHYLPEELEVRVVEDWYDAHVIVADSSQTSYSFSGPGSIGFWNGLEYDADDRFEQWSVSYVYLHEVDPSDAEDHLGYWIGLSLVGSEEELPSRYDD